MKGISKYHFLLAGLFSLFTAFVSSPIEKNKPVFHDFHTSLTEVRLKPNAASLEITLRVFTDDLQLALKTMNQGKEIDLETKQGDLAIEKYLKKHLAFIRGKEVRFAHYLGKEVETDATWLYLEFSNADTLKGFNILNSVFTELFDNQTNMMNFIYPDEKHTLLFTKEEKIKPFPLNH